jgi:medium-chain acyl-[acyl-carrier-protein] hydrolase
VQLPGREHRLRERPFTSLSALVPVMAQGLEPYFDKPFAFFGHSLGAMVAFELARHLRREDRPLPLCLFVSGRPAVQIAGVDPITYNLPEPEFIEELRNLDGTPKEVLEHPELMQLMMPLLRADFEMVQTYSYTPEPRFDFPISVYGGLEDQHVSHDQLKAWQEQTAASFVMRMFPGGHFFLHSSQPLVLRKLSEALQEIVARL